jgi:polyisoprenoid-binding protein YceI
MKRRWKTIVGVVVVLIALVVGGSWFYAKVINKAPAKLAPNDLIAALDATPSSSSTDSGTGSSDPAPTTTTAGKPTTSINGVWHPLSTSLIRYRVNESINGFDTTAVGETNHISGSLTIDVNRVRGAGLTVDMTTFHSPESRRDGQFNGRVMNVKTFPTATFNITQPIQLPTVPAEGKTVEATATGDLTLRGTTKPVTFVLQATIKNGRIGIIGTIPILFADYGIPNPSAGTVTTADHGELEFIVVFGR